MYIPKNKMSLLLEFISAGIDSPFGHSMDDDEHELINQIRDRAALCQHGDAPFLEVEVCYSENPYANVKFAKVKNEPK
jgi:hypothetical protein